MSLKAIIAVTISTIFLFASCPVSAQELAATSTDTPPVFTFLKKGDEAPFDGTLFSPSATAEILNETTTSDLRCKLRVDKEVNLVLTNCKKELDLLVNDFKSEIERAQIKITQQDKELDSLRELASKNDYNWLWGVGGVATGILVTVGVVYAVGAATK